MSLTEIPWNPARGDEFLRQISPPELCKMCTGEIKVQIFRGRGFCCTNCEKLFHGEQNEERAVSP